MTPTARLDLVLAKLGKCPSHEKAKAAIAQGLVYVNGQVCTKASAMVTPVDKLEVRGCAIPFVGRGGLKLARALEVWGIDLSGLRCVDAGASTGGFTDCMLQAGAAHVWSIDVGHDQLHESLVADERVTSLEGLDIRLATPELLGAEADFLGSDVSFISLGKVLPSLAGLIHAEAHAVCLVKPQFEAGPEHVGKRGVVKDPQVHRDVLTCVTEQARQAGFAVLDLTHSPIKGPEGNIEYLMFLQKNAGDEGHVNADLITRVVHKAHAELNG